MPLNSPIGSFRQYCHNEVNQSALIKNRPEAPALQNWLHTYSIKKKCPSKRSNVPLTKTITFKVNVKKFNCGIKTGGINHQRSVKIYTPCQESSRLKSQFDEEFRPKILL